MATLCFSLEQMARLPPTRKVPTMKSCVKRFSAILALSLLMSPSAHAQATVVDIPFEGQVFNDCTGETIFTVGSYMLVSNVVTDGTGSMHSIFVLVSKDFVGTGTTTGDSYKVISGTRLSVQSDPIWPNTVQTANSVLNVIGPRGLSMMLHSTFHIVVDSNGDVKADASNFVFKCL